MPRIFTHFTAGMEGAAQHWTEGGSMFRALLRLIILLVVVVAAASFFLGYWGSWRMRPGDGPSATTGTSGRIDTERAREAGAKVGEKAAEAASKAGELLTDSALTAKIKSKM